MALTSVMKHAFGFLISNFSLSNTSWQQVRKQNKRKNNKKEKMTGIGGGGEMTQNCLQHIWKK
jgi:hypothetical protein